MEQLLFPCHLNFFPVLHIPYAVIAVPTPATKASNVVETAIVVANANNILFTPL